MEGVKYYFVYVGTNQFPIGIWEEQNVIFRNVMSQDISLCSSASSKGPS